MTEEYDKLIAAVAEAQLALDASSMWNANVSPEQALEQNKAILRMRFALNVAKKRLYDHEKALLERA